MAHGTRNRAFMGTEATRVLDATTHCPEEDLDLVDHIQSRPRNKNGG
jgi:hypothetical protein